LAEGSGIGSAFAGDGAAIDGHAMLAGGLSLAGLDGIVAGAFEQAEDGALAGGGHGCLGWVWIVGQGGDGGEDAAGLAATGEDVAEMDGRDAKLPGDFDVLPSLAANGVPGVLDGERCSMLLEHAAKCGF